MTSCHVMPAFFLTVLLFMIGARAHEHADDGDEPAVAVGPDDINPDVAEALFEGDFLRALEPVIMPLGFSTAPWLILIPA